MLVTDNQPVAAGQLLFVLDDDDYRAALAYTRARPAAAAVERAGLDLAYTRVRAPVAGVLGVRRVQLGALVPLTPPGDVWVTAYYNERQLDRVRVGDPASVRFDAYRTSSCPRAWRRSAHSPRSSSPRCRPTTSPATTPR